MISFILAFFIIFPAVSRDTSPAIEDSTKARIVALKPQDIPALIESERGKVILLNVWATWCKPCVEEMPYLLDIAVKFGPEDLSLLLVSMDALADSQKAVIPFLRERGVKSPYYIKAKGPDEPFINAVDSSWSGAIPATVIYDRKGRKVEQFEGGQSRESFERAVEAALKR